MLVLLIAIETESYRVQHVRSQYWREGPSTTSSRWSRRGLEPPGDVEKSDGHPGDDPRQADDGSSAEEKDGDAFVQHRRQHELDDLGDPESPHGFDVAERAHQIHLSDGGRRERAKRHKAYRDPIPCAFHSEHRYCVLLQVPCHASISVTKYN